MSKLTDRQRMFCSEFIRDWNSTRAAIAAGYSKRSAGPIASRLLRKDNIRAYINAIQTDIEKQAGMTKLRSVLEYKAIAFSSIADFHSSWMERKDFDGLSHEQKSCIKEIATKVTPDGGEWVRIRLYDKCHALEAISNLLGYNPQTRTLTRIERTPCRTLQIFQDK